MESIKIILVDDHQLFRNGLKILLDGLEGFEVVAEAGNGEEFLRIYKDCPADVVLMDISMPVMDGITATRKAIEADPDARIIALSMFSDEDYYNHMIDAGVKGFLLKDSNISEVKEGIQQVYEGGNYFSQELLYQIIQRIKTRETEVRNANLSKREREILQLICQGQSNQEIADNLFISKRTVDKHRANLLSKTNSKNTASLVMYAIKNHIIEI